MKRIIISVLLISMLLGWMLLIFSMSAEPADVSSNTSGNTIRKIYNIFYPGFRSMDEAEQADIIEASQHFVRKAAHFSIYTVLGMLLSINAVYHFKAKLLRSLLPFSVGALYSVSDEIHQLYVPGRSGQISDVFLDSSGVLLGVITVLTVTYIISKRKKARS